MEKLSKLSKECIANNGLCCENRTPPFFSSSEINTLITWKEITKQFLFGKCSARPKSLCPFFSKPYCSVYKKRPIDCRTYSVSINLENNKENYIIDMNCPAVKKGLVSDNFIKKAKKTWQEKMPSKEWIKEYSSNDEEKNYKWVTLIEYQNYKKSLRKK